MKKLCKLGFLGFAAWAICRLLIDAVGFAYAFLG